MLPFYKLNPDYLNRVLLNSDMFLFKDGTIGIGFKVLHTFDNRTLYVSDVTDYNPTRIRTNPNAWDNDVHVTKTTDEQGNMSVYYGYCPIMPFDGDYVIHMFPTSSNMITPISRIDITPRTYTKELLMKNIVGRVTGRQSVVKFFEGVKKHLELPKVQLVDNEIVFRHADCRKLHTDFTSTIVKL